MASGRGEAGFSALLVDAAVRPQLIDRRGRPVALVVGIDEFEAMSRKAELGSTDARMRRLLESSAALRAGGGVTLRIGRRERRSSPFRGR